jgi:hypothetical protein
MEPPVLLMGKRWSFNIYRTLAENLKLKMKAAWSSKLRERTRDKKPASCCGFCIQAEKVL